MNNKGVEANSGCKAKTDISLNLSLNSDWLLGMLFQEHFALGEITYTHTHLYILDRFLKYILFTHILCKHKFWFWMQLNLSIWQFDSPNTHAYMFLPKRLYIYFFIFSFFNLYEKKSKW